MYFLKPWYRLFTSEPSSLIPQRYTIDFTKHKRILGFVTLPLEPDLLRDFLVSLEEKGAEDGFMYLLNT